MDVDEGEDEEEENAWPQEEIVAKLVWETECLETEDLNMGRMTLGREAAAADQVRWTTDPTIRGLLKALKHGRRREREKKKQKREGGQGQGQINSSVPFNRRFQSPILCKQPNPPYLTVNRSIHLAHQSTLAHQPPLSQVHQQPSRLISHQTAESHPTVGSNLLSSANNRIRHSYLLIVIGSIHSVCAIIYYSRTMDQSTANRRRASQRGKPKPYPQQPRHLIPPSHPDLPHHQALPTIRDGGAGIITSEGHMAGQRDRAIGGEL
ncbi:MAG: hypothetical protein Q9203_001767 [Teloschistes exilis]